MRGVCTILAILAIGQHTPAWGQVESTDEPVVEPSLSPADSLQTLKTIEAELAKIRAALSAGEDAKRYAETEAIRAEIEARNGRLREQHARLLRDLEAVATGLDATSLDEGETTDFDLMNELESLLEPLIEELKEATETPRRIERLRTRLALLKARQRKITSAVEHVDSLLAANADPRMAAVLEQVRSRWESELKVTQTKISVAEHNLERRLMDQKSVLESTKNVVGSFFATRGFNILLALAAFLGTFFAMRLFYQLLRLLVLREQDGHRTFATRLTYVVFNLLTGAIATLAALIVMYSMGDWVLLALTLLVLLGIAWASKNAVMVLFQQIHLIMNAGPVREGESVLYRSVRWSVERLGIYTRLVNPLLTGGELRLPSRTVLEMTSRPFDPDEVWFPCRPGDWVRLGDGCYGCVAQQTPDVVQVQKLGGSVVSYATEAFLAANPENLSSGFQLLVSFGVDYAHQSLATRRIPEVMAGRLRVAFEEELQEGDLRSLNVEFMAAAGSSLDCVAIVALEGRLAGEIGRLSRLVQRVLVDVCTDENWTIPFHQVTVHPASPETTFLTPAGGAAVAG